MWIPGFAFCKGCCPEPLCPGCLAGGNRHSCLAVTVAGVSGSTGDGGGCSIGCDTLLNGTYHLFEAADWWTGTSDGPDCRWASGTPSCGEGCKGRVEAELYLATQGTDNLVIARISARPHTSGTTEVLQFVANVGPNPPNCYFDELELVYDAANSSPVNCDLSGATCSVSVEQSIRCTPFRQRSASSFPWMACHRGEIPWSGCRVELDGFSNADCNDCQGINGTYIFSGPPQRLTNPNIYGWDVTLPTTVGCRALNQIEVQRLALGLSRVFSGQIPGPRLYLGQTASGGTVVFPTDTYFEGTCHCHDEQDMTPVPLFGIDNVFLGCEDGTVHIEPIT